MCAIWITSIAHRTLPSKIHLRVLYLTQHSGRCPSSGTTPSRTRALGLLIYSRWKDVSPSPLIRFRGTDVLLDLGLHPGIRSRSVLIKKMLITQLIEKLFDVLKRLLRFYFIELADRLCDSIGGMLPI